jgi:hypothetical protein
MCQAWEYDNEYDDEPVEDYKLIGVSFGAGGFKAGKHVANYYNGSSFNVNKISYVLSNSYWREDIRQELHPYDITGDIELPTNMRYKIATAIMARFSFNLSSENSIFVQINQVNLLATDVFTMETNEYNGGTSEPMLRFGKIWGKESRSMVDIGIQSFNDLEPRNWRWFYELGFNITSTKVKENAIEIGRFTQSIINRGTYIYGQPLNDEVPQTAMGIGVMGSLGFQYSINQSASLDLGISTYVQDINLEGYKKFHTNFNVFARLNLQTF